MRAMWPLCLILSVSCASSSRVTKTTKTNKIHPTCDEKYAKTIVHTCKGMFQPTPPCREGLRLMHRDPDAADAAFQSCSRQGDPFAAYGSATLNLLRGLESSSAIP